MSSDPTPPILPVPILRSLRAALRTAASTQTDPQTARDLSALCETVLLRLECDGDPSRAVAPDADTLGRLEQYCRALPASQICQYCSISM